MGAWTGWAVMGQMHNEGFPAFGYVLVALTMAVQGVTLVSLLVDAIRRSGLSEKEACYAMDVSASLWSNQKAGNGKHVSLQRVSHLPVETLQEFALGILEQLGMPKRIEVGAAVLLSQRPRMVKADLVRQEAVS